MGPLHCRLSSTITGSAGKLQVIGAAGQASVGEMGETRNVSENNHLSKKVETKVVANSFSSIHSVSSDNLLT